MSNKLLGKKHTLATRRNIILYIVTMILVLAIVAGFTNTFNTDNTIHQAGINDVIVMEAKPPATGTPSDYDLISNLKFTAYKLHHSKFFKGDTDGKVTADIGIGSYTQYLTNTRVVYNETTVFTETISTSSLKSLAEQKYAEDGIIIYRKADKISSNGVTFAKTAAQMSYDEYSKRYGSVPNQLSKYKIDTDTIIAVKDENAPKVQALNGDGSDDSGDVAFEVPDKLVPNADGNYVFTITLDPIKSSIYYRNEVRTLGGADQNPLFKAAKITITINSEWVPISTRTIETYDIEIPVLGAMTCVGDNYEVFSMVGDENGEVPERDFFAPYIEKAKNDPNYVPPNVDTDGPVSAADYLAAAFADYLSGEKNLDLSADISIGDFSAKGLTLSLNLDSLDIQAMLGSLYVKYAGDKVYIKNNKINGYIPIDKVTALTDDPTLKGLLGGLGEIDVNKIFGGDMLDVIFADCEMTVKDGIATIPMSFALNLSDILPSLGSAQIDASILINDKDSSLNSITGAVKLGDVVITINVKPIPAPKFPSVEDATDLSGIIDFVPDIINTAMQTTYGIDGNVTFNGMNAEISAYIDRTDGLSALATLGIAGIDVDITYVNDVIYIDALGVHIGGKAEELPDLIEAVLEIADFDKYQSLLSAMIPRSANEVVKMLDSLTVDKNTLNIGIKLMDLFPVSVELKRADGRLKSLAFDADINLALIGLSADISADINISEPARRTVKAPDWKSYLTFSDLAELIKGVSPYLASEGYTVELDGYAEINGVKNTFDGSFDINRQTVGQSTELSADGKINALGQNIRITYTDGALYAAIGSITVKLDTADISDIISSATELINLFTDGAGIIPDIDILEIAKSAVKSVSMKDGTLTLLLSVSGYDIAVCINLDSGKLTVSADLGEAVIKLNAVISTCKPHNISAPTGRFLNMAELPALIGTATALIEQKSIDVPVTVTIDGESYTLNIQADFNDGIKARITVNAFGLSPEITIINDRAYISVGNIRLTGTASQATELLNAVREVYPDIPDLDDILGLITYAAGNLDIDTVLGAVKALYSANGVILARIDVGGYVVSASVASDMSDIRINTTIGETRISATLLPTVKAVNITAPNGQFTSISEITEILPIISELANGLAFDIAYSVTAGKIDADGSVFINIADGISANATVNALGQTIELSYIKDVVYIGLQAVRLKLAVSDIPDIMPAVTELLGAFGIELDIEGLKGKLSDALTADNIKAALPIALDCIKSFDVKDGAITLVVGYEDYTATLVIALSSDDGAHADVTLDVDGLISLSASIKPVVGIANVPDADMYTDVMSLVPTLSAAAKLIPDLLEKGGIHTVVSVSFGSFELKAAVDATIANGELKVLVSEQSLGLTVTLLGDTAYISVGNIKVSGKLADITRLLDAVMPNLPEIIRPYIEKMNGKIMSLLPSDDELFESSDGKPNIAGIIDLALSALTELRVDNDVIRIGINRNNVLLVSLGIATDLTAIDCKATLDFGNVGGPFGTDYSMSFAVKMNGISASEMTIDAIDADEYVAASTIISVLEGIMPLAKSAAFSLDLSVTVFDQTINGNVYIDLGEYTAETIAAEVTLNAAGVTVSLKLAQNMLYVDILTANNTLLKTAQPLTMPAIKQLLSDIDDALDTDICGWLSSTLDKFKGVSVNKILDMLSLSPAENGMALGVKLDKTAIDVVITTADGVLGAIDVYADLDGKAISATLGVTNTDGVISEISAEQIDIMGTVIGFNLGIAPVADDSRHTVKPDGEYIEIAEFIQYIKPIMTLIDNAKGAKSLTLTLSAMTLEALGKQVDLYGIVDISFSPVVVTAKLTLFYGTPDAIDLIVMYTDGVVYLSLGEIKLNFDTATDVDKLNAAMSKFLPEYLSLSSLGSAMSSISAIVDNITSIAQSESAEDVVKALFDADNAYKKSVLQQFADIIRIFKLNDAVTVDVAVMDSPLSVNVSVTPIIDGDYIDFKLGVKASSMLSLGMIAKLDFSDEPLNVTAPTDIYTPVVDFVTVLVNAINTFTAKAPDQVTYGDDGSVTTVSQTAFEIESFTFDYDMFKVKTTVNENGETVDVLDEAGRPEIERDAKGEKIKEKVIKVSNISGQNALRFGLTTTKVKDANGIETSSTKLMIEAHLSIGIIGSDGKAQLGFPIELDLYVAPTETNPEGLAYLYYREANGYGEKISIDYKSIMQIVAAVLDILGADDDTIDALLKDYRLDIDSSVFDYMSISGLDEISGLIDNLVKALEEVKSALGYGKTAWNRLQNAGSIDALIGELMSDGEEQNIKSCLDGMIDHIKAAIALFKTDDEGDDEQEPEDNKLNGALVGKIVNSVYFRSADDKLSAYVNNAVATGTDGWAAVSVTSADEKVNNIGVTNLDVNKAKLNTFDMQFAPITSIISVEIPADYTDEITQNDKLRYANLANIKYLLFDIMNTANMMEFEIGGFDNAEDYIDVSLSLGDWELKNINIKYRALVKIIDRGEEVEPRFSTAAVVELKVPQTSLLGKYVLPECTTSLYFYDDVIYIQGVKDWTTSAILPVQMHTQIDTPQSRSSLFKDDWKDSGPPTTTTTQESIKSSDTHGFEYVNVMYTVDELMYMIKNDITKFLDEFLYYLLPLTKEDMINFLGAKLNVRNEIAKAINKPSTGENAQNTLAQIFKSYVYENGAHTAVIGLAELAGSSALSDITLSIVGANNGDDETTGNVLNNYVSTLSLSTSMASIVSVSLHASLNNVKENTDGTIDSRGLANVNTNYLYNSFSFNGNSYTYINNYLPDTVVTIDGLPMYTSLGAGATFASLPGVVAVLPAASYDEQLPQDRSESSTTVGGIASKTRTARVNRYWLVSGYRKTGTTVKYYVGEENGAKYVYRMDGDNQVRSKVVSIMDALLADVVKDSNGKVVAVNNRDGGVQWDRPWKAAYDAAQAA